MTAIYNELSFDTPLHARWAAFFDLAGWHWSACVARVDNWKPDFRVTFACGHSECSDSHTLLVSILDVADISGVKDHPALSHRYGVKGTSADAGALFGATPKATQWEMSHGAGGGLDDVVAWTPNAEQLWKEAKTLVHE
ncbi:hypothetical protein ISS98_16185 [Dyella flagellata]|uniref:Uncharacterized protein n=1 Tax=Dyella flagellata TaxID=1867833 RepID=A0ABQ5XDR6_9GAMM|nr:hypothetical protein GCM10007898_21490 [Dyella flagellata]